MGQYSRYTYFRHLLIIICQLNAETGVRLCLLLDDDISSDIDSRCSSGAGVMKVMISLFFKKKRIKQKKVSDF
jgi:hypothetical protein